MLLPKNLNQINLINSHSRNVEHDTEWTYRCKFLGNYSPLPPYSRLGLMSRVELSLSLGEGWVGRCSEIYIDINDSCTRLLEKRFYIPVQFHCCSQYLHVRTTQFSPTPSPRISCWESRVWYLHAAVHIFQMLITPDSKHEGRLLMASELL